MLEVTGVGGGIGIRPKRPIEVDLGGSRIAVHRLELLHPILSKVLKMGESTVTWVGRKYDGIYIDFKKLQIERLENMVKMHYGVIPMEHLEKRELASSWTE